MKHPVHTYVHSGLVRRKVITLAVVAALAELAVMPLALAEEPMSSEKNVLAEVNVVATSDGPQVASEKKNRTQLTLQLQLLGLILLCAKHRNLSL